MKKRDETIRNQLHEILDLVLDINGLQANQVEITENHPTVFFYFSGHVGKITVDLHSNGWRTDGEPDVSIESAVFKDFRFNLPAVIDKLREFKNRGVPDGTD